MHLREYEENLCLWPNVASAKTVSGGKYSHPSTPGTPYVFVVACEKFTAQPASSCRPLIFPTTILASLLVNIPSLLCVRYSSASNVGDYDN
jgi:hypothetical protein